MKRLCAVWMILFSLTGHGQHSIPSYQLSVTVKKTTNVIFPYHIEKADIGSADVIGHRDLSLGNVLFLKAVRKDIAPTNLSVYTSDGKFYSFIVTYNENPDTLNLSFLPEQKVPEIMVDSFISAKLDSDAVLILNQPSFLHRKVKSENMKVILKGIYLMDNLLWFRFTVKNHSQIQYRPTFIRFSIRDKKSGKRTAVQENPLEISWGVPKEIPGNQNGVYLFAVPSFTVPIQKKLAFQIEEKNGERAIMLNIPSKIVLACRSIEQQ